MDMLLRLGIAAATMLVGGLAAPLSSADEVEFDVEVPAGDFCPGFAVLGQGAVKGSEKLLPGDRFWEHNVGTGVWTNAESGHTFTQRSRYTLRSTFDEAANDFHITITGRFMVGFIPGDVGLAGPVTEVQTYSVAGRQTFIYDVDADALVAYSLDGTVLADVCAVLAGEG